MHRIDSRSAHNGTFRAGNPIDGTPPTALTPEWFNATQEEIVNVIAAANIPLDKTDNSQLLKALRWLIAKAIQDAGTTTPVTPTDPTNHPPTAPTITTDLPATITRGNSYDVKFASTDPDNDAVTFTLSNLVGCTAAKTTGIDSTGVSITIGAQADTVSFAVIAVDSKGAASAATTVDRASNTIFSAYSYKRYAANATHVATQAETVQITGWGGSVVAATYIDFNDPCYFSATSQATTIKRAGSLVNSFPGGNGGCVGSGYGFSTKGLSGIKSTLDLAVGAGDQLALTIPSYGGVEIRAGLHTSMINPPAAWQFNTSAGTPLLSGSNTATTGKLGADHLSDTHFATSATDKYIIAAFGGLVGVSNIYLGSLNANSNLVLDYSTDNGVTWINAYSALSIVAATVTNYPLYKNATHVRLRKTDTLPLVIGEFWFD